jgi:hypothetical protein
VNWKIPADMMGSLAALAVSSGLLTRATRNGRLRKQIVQNLDLADGLPGESQARADLLDQAEILTRRLVALQNPFSAEELEQCRWHWAFIGLGVVALFMAANVRLAIHTVLEPVTLAIVGVLSLMEGLTRLTRLRQDRDGRRWAKAREADVPFDQPTLPTRPT